MTSIASLTPERSEATEVEVPLKSHFPEPELFPVPASERAFLHFKESVEHPLRLVVTDVLGRDVREDAVDAGFIGRKMVSLTGLPAGLYFVRVISKSHGDRADQVLFTRKIPVIR